MITDPNTYKLLTPGPLTTSLSVRKEMLVDRCTWDDDYKEMTQFVRRELLTLAHVSEPDYTTVLMQGSGTFGVESVLSSVVGKNDCVLVPVNGAYSERMCQILERYGIAFVREDFAWNERVDAARLESSRVSLAFPSSLPAAKRLRLPKATPARFRSICTLSGRRWKRTTASGALRRLRTS